MATRLRQSTIDDDQTSSEHRLGAFRWVAYVLAAALTLFQLYTALYGTYVSLVQGAIHLGGALGLIYLFYPASANYDVSRRLLWLDIPLSLSALGVNLYIVWQYERLVTDAILLGYSTLDKYVAVIGILLLLEATRRCVGLPIVVIAVAAIGYGIFGPYLSLFSHPGLEWDRMATETFLSSSSVFGTPIQVSSTYIYIFLLFGVLLVRTKIGQFFTDLAFAAVGRFTGGPAKAAVIASGLQGMVSGSSISNTVASGSFTIPMMKRVGFKPEFAAATEAAASTGGQLAPPVMGAAAFIMAALTGVPYNELIVLAAVPALLYFAGVLISVHFEANRQGIVGLPVEEIPAWGDVLKRAHLLLPLIVIIATLLSGRTPTYAALLGIGTAVFVSWFRSDTRLGPAATIQLLVEAARVALPVIAACATAGIIAGTVTKTGVGGKLAGDMIELAGGYFSLTLLLTMLTCLVLGMGLPTTANYVVTATIAAPILIANFDIPLVAAHMFVFYFGILADITPPVCLAAYAGAGIANANPMRSGVNAFRLAIGAFLVPFVFVAAPVLVLEDATIATFLPVLATTLLGMICISGSVMGFFWKELSWSNRTLLFAGGLLLVVPVYTASALGLLIMMLVTALQIRKPPQAAD